MQMVSRLWCLSGCWLDTEEENAGCRKQGDSSCSTAFRGLTLIRTTGDPCCDQEFAQNIQTAVNYPTH